MEDGRSEYWAPGGSRSHNRDGDHNEVPFTIARATPCEVRFGLFLAQIAPSLQP